MLVQFKYIAHIQYQSISQEIHHCQGYFKHVTYFPHQSNTAKDARLSQVSLGTLLNSSISHRIIPQCDESGNLINVNISLRSKTRSARWDFQSFVRCSAGGVEKLLLAFVTDKQLRQKIMRHLSLRPHCSSFSR